MANNISEIAGMDNINTQVVNILHTLTGCYLAHFTALVGTFGNCITLVVLFRIGFKDTSNIILTSLAGVDLLFLVQFSTRKMTCIIERFDSFYADIHKAYTLCYVYTFDLVVVLISISHIVVISIERLIAVFFPLKVSQWFTHKSVTVILMCVYFYWIIALLPWFYSYRRVEWIYNRRYNRTYPSAVFTEWYKSNEAILKIFGYIVINSITGIFCGFVTAVSSAIWYKLRILANRRLTLTSTKVRKTDLDLRISRTLLSVCIVYCFCNIPSFIIYIGYYIFPVILEIVEVNAFVRDLDEVLLAINCAANFFIYILMSSKFYDSVTGLFKCRHSKKSHR